MQQHQREPSPATILRQAAESFHRRNRAEFSGFETTRSALHPAVAADDGAHPPASDQVALADLPFLTRRVLRIIAEAPGIKTPELESKADLDTPARSHADSLVLLKLASRDGTRYALTPAGLDALRNSVAQSDHHLARRAAALLAQVQQ